MRVTLGLLAALACTRDEPAPKHAPDGTDPTTGGDTESTPTSTAETAAPTFPEAPADPGPRLEPSVTIRCSQGCNMGLEGEVLLLPAHGADPGGVFVFLGEGPPGIPSYTSLLLPGALPNGVYDVEDVWDGKSTYNNGIARVGDRLAGDVNHDGHLDLWFGEFLHLGPFFGRATQYGVGYEAMLFHANSYPSLSNVDLNDDGEPDVVFEGYNQTNWALYGPLHGVIPGPYEPEPSDQITWFGDQSGCSETRATFFVRDARGPGKHAIGVGSDSVGCMPDTIFYDATVPAGTKLSPKDRIGTATSAGSNPAEVVGPGDLDGDGFGEIIFGDEMGGFLIHGPLLPDVNISDFMDYGYRWGQVGGHVHQTLGDLNGDGVDELLGTWLTGTSLLDNPRHRAILFSPHPDPLLVWEGVYIGTLTELGGEGWGNPFGRFVADIDGDGLNDLVATFMYRGVEWQPPLPSPEFLDAGEVRIWYGKDIVAAEVARIAAGGTP